MKKAISKNKVQRMRNLVTGDYSKKTTIQSGYSVSAGKHTEGDVWEERGKTWTIIKGIKQTITKLDKAREHARIPMTCPKCNAKMNREQHKFMYVRFKHCLFCQTTAEQKMHDEGTYDSWKNEKIKDNFEIWLLDKKEEFKDFLQTRHSKKQITEAGQIEDWRGGQSDEEMIADFDIYINNELERLNATITSNETKEK